MCGVGDGAGGGGRALAVDVSDGLCAHVENERVHQRNVVLVPRLCRHLQPGREREHVLVRI